jgi:ABC-2 type transport system permease protein
LRLAPRACALVLDVFAFSFCPLLSEFQMTTTTLTAPLSSSSSARAKSAPAASRAIAWVIFARELVFARKSFLAWTLPAALMQAMILVVQPEMAKEGSVFQAKLELLPKEMMAAFGLAKLDLTNPVSYLATNATLLWLLGALFAGVLGATIVSKEEAYGTGETLYTWPVSRTLVVVVKAMAGLVPVVLYDVVLLVTALATYAAIGVAGYDRGLLAELFVGGALLHMCIFTLALVVSIRLRRPRGALPVALAFVFGLYGAGVIGTVSDKLSFVAHLSPFRLVDPSDIVARGGLAPGAALLPVVAFLAITLTVALFARKDLHA